MGSFISCFYNVLLAAEKVSLWFACTMLICCLITTITVVLGMGIGLGYNYCFTNMVFIHNKNPDLDLQFPDYKRVQRKARDYGMEMTYPNKITNETADLTTKVDENNSSAPVTKTAIVETLLSTIQTSKASSHKTPLQKVSSEVPSNFTATSMLVTKLFKTSTYPDEYYEQREGPEQQTLDNDSSNKEYVNVDENDVIPHDQSIIKNVSEHDTSTSVASHKPVIQEIVPKMVIPITGVDLIGLLSKLRANDKNYTLQIITT